MTELLYHADAYLADFKARMVSVKDGGPVLDRTAFYPGGGGQPADRGALLWEGQPCRLTRVKKVGEDVVH